MKGSEIDGAKVAYSTLYYVIGESTSYSIEMTRSEIDGAKVASITLYVKVYYFTVLILS